MTYHPPLLSGPVYQNDAKYNYNEVTKQAETLSNLSGDWWISYILLQLIQEPSFASMYIFLGTSFQDTHCLLFRCIICNPSQS